MSKNHLNITDAVMDRIQSGNIHMRPKWYFVLGSAGLILALIGLAITSAYLISLVSFSLRTHGPMASVRYQQILSGFPWWAPVLILAGSVSGVYLLKKFDFSYRKNFLAIALIFLIAVILSGLAIDQFGISDQFARQGMMRRFYQQYDGGFRGDFPYGNRRNGGQMFRGQ